MPLRVVEADLARGDHGEALVELLDDFVRDPSVAGRPLDPSVRASVVDRMRAHGAVRAWLAFEDDAPAPLGFAVGIVGFSTFAAKPVLNVHDLGVRAAARGRGIGRALLEAMESAAREAGCCKLTLEVRADNLRARALYARFGFDDFAPGGEPVPSLFLEKRVAAG